MKSKVMFFALLISISTAPVAFGFGAEGCGAGECVDCHALSPEQAADVLSPLGPNIEVEEVKLSEVPGLWSVVVLRPDGMRLPIYLDFSLTYLLQGEAIKIATRENVTRSRIVDLNKIDPSIIPLDDAVVFGKPDARHKIVVFDDPECPYCQKMQESMSEIVAKRPDIAFYIKMLPLDMHPTAYDKAKAIVCEKSLELLEKSLAGEEIPPPSCETDVIEKNKELAAKLRVRSTPTLIFPDGRVVPGFKSPGEVYKLLADDETLKSGAMK